MKFYLLFWQVVQSTMAVSLETPGQALPPRAAPKMTDLTWVHTVIFQPPHPPKIQGVSSRQGDPENLTFL